MRMLRFIQEVNTTTRSCALWDLEEDTEYIVHVQAISIQGQSPASEPLLFKTPREAEKMASKNKGKPGRAGVPGWGQLGEGGWAEQGGSKSTSKDGGLLWSSFGVSPNAATPSSLHDVPGTLHVGCLGIGRGTSSCGLGPGGTAGEERSPALANVSPQTR